MAKETLKERMERKRAELKAKGTQGAIYYLKADTTVRVRILNMGEENDFIQEVIQFYLGSEIKGVISPASFGEPCAVNEAFNELKASDEDDDRELANKFPPRTRYLAYCAFYKDLQGKELDENLSPKFMLLAAGTYQDILELYLDEDEWGNMTDPDEGYDIKIGRTGSGKTDTEYTVSPCKNTPAPKAFRKEVYDLKELAQEIMPTYEKTKQLIEQFLGLDPTEEEEKPEKGKKRIKKIIKKKQSDID